MLVIFTQTLVELATLVVGDWKLGHVLGIPHDAVPELLHERQTRLHVEREEIFHVRGSHTSKIARDVELGASEAERH
jgi:hypothetical protein